MSRTVLFAGGPLHGKTMVVERAPIVYALEPAEVSPGLTDPFGPAPRQVAYSLSRFALCRRLVWIGHPGTEPDEDLVFEVLTSEGAKAASCVTDPAPF